MYHRSPLYKDITLVHNPYLKGYCCGFLPGLILCGLPCDISSQNIHEPLADREAGENVLN